MAIKDPLLFITIEEFKNWKGFNNQLFDEIITPDSEIRYAIEIASSNIDYLSGFTISKKWPEINPTKFTDNIQTATIHYVNFLLSKGVEYARGQASIGQGGIVYSQNNPEEPYFIPPQVFNYLRDINEYLNIKGFNLKGIEPQKNHYFNKFISNCGEDSPLNAYIPYTNIKSLDDRTKITITHPQNMLRPVVNIDTTGIKSLDNLTTNELFTQYFSNDSLQLVDGKQGQKPKVISISDNVPNMLINELTYNTLETENKTISGAINEINDKSSGSDSLWEVDPNSSNIIQPKVINGQKPIITSNNKRIILVADPEQSQDSVNKRYVDNEFNNYYKKEEIDNKWLEDFPIDFETNANYNEIENLQTEAKQIVPAINENKENIDKKQGKRSKNLITTAKTIVEGINENKVNIDKKQNKLTAGDNITIDENNVISATGELNPNNFYTKDEIDNNLKIGFDFIDSIKQNKLIPNGNIEITEDNKIRAFDASFDNNKFLKNYSLYDSKDNVNASDLVMGTCGYIDKWYQHKLISTEEVVIEDNKIVFTREV